MVLVVVLVLVLVVVAVKTSNPTQPRYGCSTIHVRRPGLVVQFLFLLLPTSEA